MFLISLLWCAVVCLDTAFAAELPIQTNNKMYVDLVSSRKVLTQCRLAYINPNIHIGPNISYRAQFIDGFEKYIELEQNTFNQIRQSCNYNLLDVDNNEKVIVLSDHASLAVIADMFAKSNLVNDTKDSIYKFLKNANELQKKILNKKRQIKLTQQTLALLQILVCRIFNQDSSISEDDKVNIFQSNFTLACKNICNQQIRENKKQLKTYLIIAGCIFLLCGIPFTYADHLKKGKIKEFYIKGLIGFSILGGIIF